MTDKCYRRKKNLPSFKKDIKDFVLNEEGKISKKNIAKIGISLAILEMMFEPMAQAGPSHSSHASHSSGLFSTGRGGHQSTTTHANTHSNHSNHSQGSWC